MEDEVSLRFAYLVCVCMTDYLCLCMCCIVGKVAMVVAPVLLTLFMLFSGFFINSGSIPVYYRWIKVPAPHLLHQHVTHKSHRRVYGWSVPARPSTI